jgi:hypothetical protein
MHCRKSSKICKLCSDWYCGWHEFHAQFIFSSELESRVKKANPTIELELDQDESARKRPKLLLQVLVGRERSPGNEVKQLVGGPLHPITVPTPVSVRIQGIQFSTDHQLFRF